METAVAKVEEVNKDLESVEKNLLVLSGQRAAVLYERNRGLREYVKILTKAVKDCNLTIWIYKAEMSLFWDDAHYYKHAYFKARDEGRADAEELRKEWRRLTKVHVWYKKKARRLSLLGHYAGKILKDLKYITGAKTRPKSYYE